MRTRKLLVLVVLTALSLGAIGTARSEPLKLRIAWIVPVTNLASILFAKSGVAKHNGQSYVVETIRFQGSTPQISALANGELDLALLGFTSMPLAIENAGMDDLRALFSELQDGALGYYSNEYMVLADGPVRKVEDLKGKVLATNALGSAADIAMRAMLSRYRLEDKRDYTTLEAPFPTMRAILAERKADLIPSVPPFSTQPEMRKIGRTLFTEVEAIGIGELGLWAAREEFIRKNRAALVDFLEDYLRVIRFYTDPANHKEAVDIAAGFSKLPAAVFDDWLFTKKDYYRDPNGRVDMKSLQTTFDVQRKLGFLKTEIDASRYTDFTVVEEAAKRLN
jgi:NitT/TauT family transport system substrate-binding protein